MRWEPSFKGIILKINFMFSGGIMRKLYLFVLSLVTLLLAASCLFGPAKEHYSVSYEWYNHNDYIFYEEGDVIEKPDDPVVPGSTFLGWYTRQIERDHGQYVDPDSHYDGFGDRIYRNVTLYAAFAPDEWMDTDTAIGRVFEDITDGDNAISISTADELRALAEIIRFDNSDKSEGTTYFDLPFSQELYGFTITIENDIDLSGEDWIPIYLPNSGRFSPDLVGNGPVTISGITIDVPNRFYSPIGFISSYRDGIFRDITLSGTIIVPTGIEINSQIGGFIGTADYYEYSSIAFNDCVSDFVFDISSIDYGNYIVGGFIGSVHSQGQFSFDGCENRSTLTGGTAGGFIGELNTSGNITAGDCINTGSVSGNYAAGFASILQSTNLTIMGFRSPGTISSLSDSGEAACVSNEVSATNIELSDINTDGSYSTTSLFGDMSASDISISGVNADIRRSNTGLTIPAGGIADAISGDTIKIKNCTIQGNIEGNYYEIGGFFGTTNSHDNIAIEDSSFSGNLHSTMGANIGGLIGSSNDRGIRISNCSVSGNYSSDGDNIRVYGFIGLHNSDEISITGSTNSTGLPDYWVREH